MKFPLTLIPLLTLLCAIAFATPKKNVAIYMAGTESIKGSYKVLGAELAKVLTKSDAYTAVDRSEAGRKIVSTEHIFQRSGAVEKDQIKKLGKQLGVQIVCIAEITEVMQSQYLEARLVDVETAEVFNIASKLGNMSIGADIVRTAQSVAHELLGEAKIANYSLKELETNPDMAIEDYTEAIRQKSNVAEYYYKRGTAYYFKKDYGRAISDLNEAIRLNPNYVEAYNNRGLAYYNKKDYDKAISDYNEAIRLNPNCAEAYNNRGVVYDNKGDNDRAISDYTQAIQLNPNYAEAYSNRGVAYNGKGDHGRAISDNTEAIRLDPNFAEAYISRGSAYNNKGDYDKAISDCDEAIRLDPNISFAYNNRGFAYHYKGNYDKAMSDYNEAIRLKPKWHYDIAYAKRGDVYAIKKDYSKAKADYESALRIDPDSYSAKRGLEEIKEMMKK